MQCKNQNAIQCTRYQDFTQELPEQLLCKIFDHLDFTGRCKAALTCSRWDAILHSDHFLARMRFVLDPDSLAIIDPALVARMKRHRNFVLKHSKGNHYLALVHQFLSDLNVAGRVEELTLKLDHFSLVDLFPGGPIVSMPNLRRLIVLPRVYESAWNNCRPCLTLDAPNLKCLEFRLAVFALEPVIYWFAEQVESIVIRDIDMLAAFHLLGQFDFPHLTSLALIKEEDLDDYMPSRFSINMVGTLAKLRHLKIISQVNSFTNSFGVLLIKATSLESLYIKGSDITPAGLICISKMSRLKELHLEGCLLGQKLPPIALDSLERLTVTQQLFSLIQAPRLTWVRVMYYAKLAGRIEIHTDEAKVFFPRACFNVRKLFIEGVDLHDTICEQIWALRRVELLVLTEVTLTPEAMRKMKKVFGDRVHFNRCPTVDRVYMNDVNNNLQITKMDDRMEMVMSP